MSLSTEIDVGERQPMSRMRGLPSSGSGRCVTRGEPEDAAGDVVPDPGRDDAVGLPAADHRDQTAAVTRDQQLGDRRPVMPGTRTSRRPSATTITRARPAPRSSTQIRSR